MNTRAQIAYAHDLVMTALSFVIALYLRLGDDIQWLADPYIWTGGGVLTLIGGVIYWASGLYRGVWRYASMRDLTAITRATSLTILVFVVVMFFWTRLEFLPRSVPIINWFVLMALLGGPRLAYRLYRDRKLSRLAIGDYEQRIPVILVGASDGAELFIRGLERSPSRVYNVVGIVAEHANRVGQQIHGVNVIGHINDLPHALNVDFLGKHKPQRLILSKDTFDGTVVRQLFDFATNHGMTVARIPRITDLRDGSPDNIQTRPIDVEDLLGRPQAALDRDAMRSLVEGKRVLITGAGGSIGGELVRQIAALTPSEIGLLESSEYNLYEVDQELARLHPTIKRRAMIADVRNAHRINVCFELFRPMIVFHAAALKHVPLVEDNVSEGVLTNVAGTINVANACKENGVRTMVQVSTDKAVNPTNVMGMTKRVAEQYCQAQDIDDANNETTQFVTVRFGNVLGSTGSVIPLFQKQLARGGPLTVTHPDMTRYFMTVREAVELVLMASAEASRNGVDSGRIFVLDMGQPVRIMTLAEQMIRLAGKEPGRDIAIEITGCRPGEKLFEEIFHGQEKLVPAGVPGLLLAAPRATEIDILRPQVNQLIEAAKQNDDEKVVLLLCGLVPEAQREMNS